MLDDSRESVGIFSAEEARIETLPFTHQHETAIYHRHGYNHALLGKIANQGYEASGLFSSGLKLQLYRIADFELGLVE